MQCLPRRSLMKVIKGSYCFSNNKNNNNNNNNNLIYLALVALLVTSLFSCFPNQIVASIQSDLEQIDGKGFVILEGATLVDGTGSPPRYNSVVVLKDERILTVTDKAKYTTIYPKDSVVVNLTGRFLIPGLFDMHAHVAGVLNSPYNQTISENTLKALLDKGITTIRNPGGPTKESVALRDAVATSQIKGPQIFTAGRLINGPQFPTKFVETIVNTESEIREEVRRQANAGVDYVKLYVGLYPNLVSAAIDEAHFQGIKVIGHLFLTSWTDAAQFSIDALTHALPESPYLVPSDKREMFLKVGVPWNHLLWLDLVNLDGPEIDDMINALVQNKVAVDPTLVIFDAMYSQDNDGEEINSNRQFMKLWPKALQLVKMLYDRDVLIMAGSDIPNFGLVPGISLHHEMELLADAGIPPLEVIKIGTKNGAEALGILNDVGTIEDGKQADMIILNANPISNIRNIGVIDGVIEDGQFFNQK
jgi:imidazolonepropionase-like amidohydrolase